MGGGGVVFLKSAIHIKLRARQIFILAFAFFGWRARQAIEEILEEGGNFDRTRAGEYPQPDHNQRGGNDQARDKTAVVKNDHFKEQRQADKQGERDLDKVAADGEQFGIFFGIIADMMAAHMLEANRHAVQTPHIGPTRPVIGQILIKENHPRRGDEAAGHDHRGQFATA